MAQRRTVVINSSASSTCWDVGTGLRHLGVIVDGSRRWAKARALSTADGHRAGAEKIHEVLDWCEESGIQVVTMWVLSVANLRRPADELSPLLNIIEDLVLDLHCTGRWDVRPIGDFGLLPKRTAAIMSLVAGAEKPQPGAMQVNVAVAYGGREELVGAVRRSVAELAARGYNAEDIAEALEERDIARHLYTSGQPDPDLVIRTSGEQRLSGFMAWQGFQSELYFCTSLWPDLTRRDFDAALASYDRRSRTRGA
ncbi:di-trans,poly-cis-decaprenylcistransferase [Kitasatospora acidiphila]|uniref:Isoprenyl transferase n=1 Tax=Kitasatospora acidiphila TaxID=2567942 RepID=A0A540W944_9ACTN|nr:polyprenyl diphosphate synthase [Kitasatospora acidiphila]TQF05523.1 di-trans,poly-cis-decaprenylcistransferase [Kitasatospora acidiphila]